MSDKNGTGSLGAIRASCTVPMSQALIVVDFQNDFTPPDGALAVPGGDAIADRLNELAAEERFDVVIATRDWHPADHGSFRDQGGPWPPHCVQGTEGAQLHPALDRSLIDAVVDKGQRRESEGYSAFESPELGPLLREHEIMALTIVGLATDYCVLNTARDALKEAFTVTVDRSATRAVDANPGDGDRALAELEGLGAIIA
jgi:nicotinamidase/pyrazinamidase